MKRTLWRAGMVALFLALLLPVVLTAGFAAETGEGTTPPTVAYEPITDYYCRGALAKLSNATALLYAYDAIVAGVENTQTEIDVHNGSDPLSTDELRVVVDAYRRDYAEHFWFGSSYSYTYNGDTVLCVKPTYTMTGDALVEARLLFEAKLERILAAAEPSASELALEVFFHDYLAASVDYVLDAPHAHDAYGAIVEGKAVCEGYAEALQVLLHRVGIQSLIVLGSSVNPETGESEGHAWNMVRIDGAFYHVDLTWNDQDNYLYHAYFNVTDTEIQFDHDVEEPAFRVPVCSMIEAQYFNAYGGRYGAPFERREIVRRLEQNGYQASFYVQGDRSQVDAFLDWLREVGAYINAELKSSGLSYTVLGREVVITAEVCRHRNLSHVPATPATCWEDGGAEHYRCDNCGQCFWDRLAQNPVVHESALILYTAGHLWTEKHEDEAHRRTSATDCRERDSYWYTCAVCGVVSESAYFERAEGAHSYADAWSAGDETGHWHDCTLCDGHDQPVPHDRDGFTCGVCGYTPKLDLELLLGYLQKGMLIGLASVAGILILILLGVLLAARRMQKG